VGRLEDRIFRLNDEIEALRQAEQLAANELDIHRHLNDDAQRDAAVSDNPFDRADARDTAADVARFERHIAKLQQTRIKLEAKRDKLLAKLG
jgi:hypothetical protein